MSGLFVAIAAAISHLVEPANKDGAKRVEREKSSEKEFLEGGSGGGDEGLHPFIQGLLKSLPAPNTDWPMSARKKWLTTAENIFGMIYSDSDDVSDLV